MSLSEESGVALAMLCRPSNRRAVCWARPQQSVRGFARMLGIGRSGAARARDAAFLGAPKRAREAAEAEEGVELSPRLAAARRPASGVVRS